MFKAYRAGPLPPANGGSSYCLTCDLNRTPCCPDKAAGDSCPFVAGRVREAYTNTGVCAREGGKPGLSCVNCGLVDEPCCNPSDAEADSARPASLSTGVWRRGTACTQITCRLTWRMKFVFAPLGASLLKCTLMCCAVLRLLVMKCWVFLPN